ncbi:MAG: methyltransferase domain-containing protein [Gammaproteobacteria bacterium]|nr:methyltransferase domain-containing protein [Gammaproteobacteria bacterium]
MVAITSMAREHILEAVQLMYADVANNPDKEFHFPTGRQTCIFLGYPEAMLDAVPATAVESFAGVGYPFAAAGIQPGNTVLDIGSGSGTDTLVAANLVGSAGKVYGLDMTRAMQEKLARNIELMDIGHVEVLPGNAEEIPLPDASVDVITSNGVINLVPDKPLAIREMFRVLRPGGRIQITDIVIGVGEDTLADVRNNPRLWAECIVGAVTESGYFDMFEATGFARPETLNTFDYFSESSKQETREIAASFQAHGILLTTTRPAS